MGKQEKAAEVAPRARRIAELRVSGHTFEAIGLELGLSAERAHDEAEKVFATLVGEDSNSIRTTSELRLDGIVSAANRDLRSATTQAERSTLYGLILRAEAQRAALLGLALPKGGS